MKYNVCKLIDLEESGSLTFDLGDKEIGVILHKGKVHAFENACAHMGGPVCLGDVQGRVKMELNSDKSIRREYVSDDKAHIVCPWHGFEFDIETGEFVTVSNIKLNKFNTYISDGEVVVEF